MAQAERETPWQRHLRRYEEKLRREEAEQRRQEAMKFTEIFGYVPEEHAEILDEEPGTDYLIVLVNQSRRRQREASRADNLRTQPERMKAYVPKKGIDNSSGSGIIRKREERGRVGEPVKPTEKTLETSLNRQLWAEQTAKKYNINLRGSGRELKITLDDSIPMGVYGFTSEWEPNTIYLGPYAFSDEKQLARTIAHELNHSRSFLRGGKAPESTARVADKALGEYIEGKR